MSEATHSERESPIPEDPQELREAAAEARGLDLTDLAAGLERVADRIEEREADE